MANRFTARMRLVAEEHGETLRKQQDEHVAMNQAAEQQREIDVMGAIAKRAVVLLQSGVGGWTIDAVAAEIHHGDGRVEAFGGEWQ